MTAPAEVRIELDPNDLRAFLAALKRFEPALATALRRQLRQSGDEAISAMRDTIMSLPTRGRDRGVRAAISAGIRTQVMTSKRSNGVRITASGSRLGSRAALLKALNASSFRHPLFGDTRYWYTQQGRPYFGAVLKSRRAEVLQAIEQALDEATAKVGAAA